MRALATSLLALVAAVPALAEEVFTQAPIAAATVYPSGAEVVHRATVELPAGRHIVFLPHEGLEDLTALPRIRTSEGVTIGTLGLRRDVGVDREALFTAGQAEAWAAVEALEDRLAAQDDEIALAAAAVRGLDSRLAFLTSVRPGEDATAEEILALADTVARETEATEAALVGARAALRPLEAAREDLAADLEAAMAAFDKLSPPAAVADLIAVEVDVAAAGPVTLELTALVPDAWWEMDYDLDLQREAGRLDIARKLVVVQETGQSWSDVALTLSTARPGETVSPSPVSPDMARIIEPMDYDLRARAGLSENMAAAPMMEPAPMVVEADMTTATLEIDGLALSYVYPEPVTIASGEAAELALDRLGLDAESLVVAAPRHDETAFTVARFTNTTGEPILPGWANILRDGHMVGRERIELIPAGAESELGFGPIEGIRLATIFERNAEGDAGLISKSNTREQRIVFTVENLTGEAQEVRALFPLTFSEQEDLRVRVSTVPTPDETDIGRERGVSAWNLALAPGETKEVRVTVQLDWPDGQELIWYP